MVETKLEPEVIEVNKLADNGQNFLLSGGAGSGKTYSLVQVIKSAISRQPTAKIACMTYTNAAVREIEERVNHPNLVVSTIHDFLWDNIKNFRKELKKGLITIINDEDSKIKLPEGTVEEDFYDSLEDGIQYKEYVKIKEGIISHDEVLVLANYMFKTYSVLCDILIDKFKYILIDEYQDTNPLVIEIFLLHLKQSKKRNIIGFFGDAMQSIYDDGIGDLNDYIGTDVVEVQKTQNRRNPASIINLANKFRTDGIIQQPSEDEYAPNMVDAEVKEGKILFLYSNNNNINEIKRKYSDSYFENWDFKNALQTKELNLTHNLIAPKAGFPTLMAIYDKDPIIEFKNQLWAKVKSKGIEIDENKSFEEIAHLIPMQNRQKENKIDLIKDNPDSNYLFNQLKDKPFSFVRKIYLSKDSLIDDKKQDAEEESKKGSKRDNLIKHLFKIQENILLYQQNNYNAFIRKTNYHLKYSSDKAELKKRIDSLVNSGNKSIEEIIELANNLGICVKDDKLDRFVNENEYLFNRVKQVRFKEFQNLFNYLEGYTPFSTQHKVKGTEFENVFVILDNGGWNNYNFEYLFTNRVDKIKVLNRTQKIFYVCCTRAMENLVVFFHSPSNDVIINAIKWFGKNNVHEIK